MVVVAVDVDSECGSLGANSRLKGLPQVPIM